MKEFTLNRLPEFDTEDYIAFGRVAEEEEEATPVPFVMVPIGLWTSHYGNATQINVQLSR